MKFNFLLIVKSRLAFALVLFLALSINAGAQLNVGSAAPPNANAMLQVNSNNNKGFLLSQVALVSTSSPLPLTAHVAGMMVYNTATSGSGSTAVTPGIYTNDGTRWSLISMQSGTSPATYTGSTLTCAGTQSGTYQAGIAMTGSNTQIATITLATTGSYIVTTTTVNGVSFYASGTALSTGASNFTLTASGTPVALGTFAYPISFGGQNCTFNVTYSGNTTSGGGAVISSTTCGSAVVTGTLSKGVAASGVTVSIPVNTTTAGNYVIATTTVNGISWSGTGTLTAGAGNIVLTASGTPATTGAVSYPLNTSPGCSFNATSAASPSSGGTSIISATTCGSAVVTGTLTNGVVASGVTVSIPVNTTTAGTYVIATTTVSGITWSGSGTLASGAGNIVLTASGTPVTAGAVSYSLNTSPGCSFSATNAVSPSSGGSSIISATTCGSANVTGTLTNGVAASGVTVSIPVNTTTAGTYVIATTAVSGITWSGSGTLAAGAGTIMLTASGTPAAAGAVSYPLNTSPTCSFSATNAVSPSSGGSAIVSAWNCTGTDAGSLQVGIAANGVTHAITATVTTVGTYSVTTTTNGITYTGSGTFAGTGSQVITLTASGTPTTSGSNSFTTSAAPTCSFTTTVATAASFACGTATTVQSPTGALVNGTVYTGSYTIAYTAGNNVAYDATTQTINGLTLTRVAGTYAAGGGNVVYNLTGTAGAAATAVFTIPECTSVTFGFLSPTSGGTGVVSAWDCTGTDAGSLQVGVAASGVTHAITATVTTVGTYNVTATTNGVTYSASGTFAGTGSQTITLTASGIPTTQGSNSFTTSATTACSFTETVAPAATFACGSATTVQSPVGVLVNNTAYTGSYTIAYTVGNGTSYGTTTQTVNGLTLTRVAGSYASGGGNVVYNLTGTAGAAAAASFIIPECTTATFGCANDMSMGSGTIVQMMYDNTGSGIANYSWCARTVVGPDGLTWLDRNLGAYQVATSSTDAASYGSIYQWGRNSDGHQIAGTGRGVDNAAISTTTSTLATSNITGNKLFITNGTSPNDWQSDNNNNRWNNITGSGVTLVQENNPCPSGYHVPTSAQQVTLTSGWSTTTPVASAYNSTLKLPLPGWRTRSDGSLNSVGNDGQYWSATPNSSNAYNLYFYSIKIYPSSSNGRAYGSSVRCVKN